MTRRISRHCFEQAVDLDERVARARPAPRTTTARVRRPRSGTSRLLAHRPRSTRRRGGRAARGRRRPGPRCSPDSAAWQWPSARWTTPDDWAGVEPQRAGLARAARAARAPRAATASRTFLGAPHTPATTRWLSIEGTSTAVEARLSRPDGSRAGARASSATAARIAAIGAGRPVQRSTCERGLVHEHAEPVDDRGARAPRAAASSGVSSGWYTRSTTTWPALQRRRPEAAAAGRRRPCRPASRSRRCRPRPPRSRAVVPGDRVAAGASGRGRAAAVGPRGRDRDVARPRRPSARATARAAPPAPSTSTGRAGGVDARRRRSERRKPVAVGRVAGERGRRRASVTVLTLRSAAASGESSSHSAATAVLCGIVTDRPDEAERAHRVERGRAPRRRAPRTRRRPSRGRARGTRRCAARGDSECRTGSPITPATPRRAGDHSSAVPPWPPRCSAAAARACVANAWCAVLVDEHVVEVRRSAPGASAACSDASLTAPIGVGGSPVCEYVLYGDSMLQVRRSRARGRRDCRARRSASSRSAAACSRASRL